jgi:mannitol-1-phosphate/altronate dehydrogenase
MYYLKLFEQFIHEMFINDHRAQRILNHIKTANSQEIKRCKKILTDHENCTIQDILSSITDAGYEELQSIEEEIFGKENVDKKTA